MIKKTFYNLPQEKKQRIIDAVMSEFSSSETGKVNINRIIKAANISRGSFYQYFDDKVDLVEVLAKNFVEQSFDKLSKTQKSCNNDIFDTYEKLFDIITNFTRDNHKKLILKNLLKNLRANDDLISEYMLYRFDGLESLHTFCNKFNTENLRYKNDDDVKLLAQILTQELKNALFNVFVIGTEIEDEKNSYLRKLEIIKFGAIL